MAIASPSILALTSIVFSVAYSCWVQNQERRVIEETHQLISRLEAIENRNGYQQAILKRSKTAYDLYLSNQP